jgi:hypothetical protein
MRVYVCVCVCTYAYINVQIHTNSYRIQIRDRIRNSLKSRIRDRIRKKSFRIHITAAFCSHVLIFRVSDAYCQVRYLKITLRVFPPCTMGRILNQQRNCSNVLQYLKEQIYGDMIFGAWAVAGPYS